MAPNYGDAYRASPNTGILEALCGELLARRAEVERLSSALASAQAEVKDLEERRIPAEYVGESCDVNLPGGCHLKVESHVFVSPKTDRREDVAAWVETEESPDLVKWKMVAEFPRKTSQEDMAQARQAAEEAGADVSLERSVHPSTLRALVRRRLEDGRAVDFDLLGVHVVRRAVVSAEVFDGEHRE